MELVDKGSQWKREKNRMTGEPLDRWSHYEVNTEIVISNMGDLPFFFDYIRVIWRDGKNQDSYQGCVVVQPGQSVNHPIGTIYRTSQFGISEPDGLVF
jgi:hypothetical protein